MDPGDINCVSPSMQFASVLDAPLYSKVADALVIYHANLNSSPGLPQFVSILGLLIFLLQIVGPALLVNMTDLWGAGSLQYVLSVIGGLWQGSGTSKDETRMVVSICLALLFVAYFGLVLERAFTYKKFVHVSGAETVFINVMSKHVLPLLSVPLFSGIPSGIYMIYTGSWGYIVPVVMILVGFVYYHFCFIQYVNPRATIESSVFHEWGCYEVDVVLVTAAVSSAVSTCVEDWDVGWWRFMYPVFICVLWVVVATLNIVWIPCVKKQANIAISAMGYTAAIVAILNVVSLTVYPLQHEWLLMAMFVIFFVMYLILKLILDRYAVKMLVMCDEFMDDMGDVKELMNRRFRSSRDFVVKMRHMVEYWHPYFAQFAMFKYAMDRWKRSYLVVIMYARLLSFFPERTSEMVWLADRISKMKTRRPVFSYLLQFRRIARTRQYEVTTALKSQLELAEVKGNQLTILLRRFWENILQKNTSSFWEDASKLTDKTKDLNCIYERMMDDYPNVIDCYDAFIDFSVNLKRDMIQASKLRTKLIRREFGEMDRDLAVLGAVSQYPVLHDQLADFIGDDCSFGFERQDIPFADRQQEGQEVMDMGIEVRMVMQTLTKHSALGSILVGLIIIVLATFGCIGLILFYHFSILDLFVARQATYEELLYALHRGLYDIDVLMLDIVTLPMFILSGTASIGGDVMPIVAPNLYPNSVPLIHLERANVSSQITLTSNTYENLVNAMGKQDQNSRYVQELYSYFTNRTIIDGRDVKSMLAQIMIDAQNVLEASNNWSVYKSYDYNHLIMYHDALSDVFQEMGQVVYNLCRADWNAILFKLSERMALVAIVVMMTITLPYMLQLFTLQVQADAMAESFTYFANTEVREIITNLGSNSKHEADDVTQASKLSQAAYDHTGEAVKLGMSFLLSFGVLTACCIILYYECDSFVNTVNNMTDMLSTLYTPFSYLEVAAMNLIRVYQVDVDPATEGSEPREKLLERITNILNETIASFNEGMWGHPSTIRVYFKNPWAFDTFDEEIPQELDQILVQRSPFEVLATSEFPDSLDLLVSEFDYFVKLHNQTKCQRYDPRVMGLLYWFLDFAPPNRTDVYVELVQEEIDRQLEEFMDRELIVIVFMIIWQLLVLLFMIFVLIEKHVEIRSAMNLYHFVSPNVLSDSHNAIVLIETGQRATETNMSFGFGNTDEILAKISQGVVITNKDLVITDFNDAFWQMVVMPEAEIEGARITDVIIPQPENRSWPNVIVRISDALSGKASPSFSETVTARLANEQAIDFNCNVICMTARKAASETEFAEIESIAFILDDTTEFRIAEKIIEREQRELRQLILKLIPRQVLEEIEAGNEQFCFLASGITVGEIRISSTAQWDYRTTERLSFVNSVCTRFNEELAKFPLLSTIRMTLDSYMFVGGLFTEVARAEEHVKQAIEFSLRVLDIVPDLAEATGAEVKVVIGLHVGGPIVAGIMSLSRPNFQIIGPIIDYAHEMMATGIEGQIHISRAVYELTYSLGFNVHERGEITMSGGQVVSTYTITP